MTTNLAETDHHSILAQALALKKSKNLKGAMNKLRHKKRLEQAIDQIEAQKDNIQTIKMSAYRLPDVEFDPQYSCARPAPRRAGGSSAAYGHGRRHERGTSRADRRHQVRSAPACPSRTKLTTPAHPPRDREKLEDIIEDTKVRRGEDTHQLW